MWETGCCNGIDLLVTSLFRVVRASQHAATRKLHIWFYAFGNHASVDGGIQLVELFPGRGDVELMVPLRTLHDCVPDAAAPLYVLYQ